jgi:tetratricopeptide (TPR) repeat protein
MDATFTSLLNNWPLTLFLLGVVYRQIKQYIEFQELLKWRLAMEQKIKDVEETHRETHSTLFNEINQIKQSLGKIEIAFDFIKEAIKDLKKP